MSFTEDENLELVAYVTGASELDIVPAERSRDWMVKTGRSFANRCLPLLMANESGWWLRNRHAFTATWNGGPSQGDIGLRFDDSTLDSALRFKDPSSTFGYGILTWSIPCVFRTPPGVDLLVRGPANLPKDGATALEGLVATDWIEATYTMNWKLTRAGLPVRFERGEPFAMVLPQGRLDLERYRPVVRPLRDAPALRDQLRQWTERRKLEHVRAFAAEHVPGIGGPQWDGSYMRGERQDSSRFEDHRVRRELRSFTVTGHAGDT
jgi:hypothetical protein